MMLCVPMLAVSCLQRDFVEADGILTVNKREMLVPADLQLGRNLVKDTLYVTSNRTWTARFQSDVDWVSLDTPAHQNMGRTSDIVPIAFTFKDNMGDEERSVKLKLCCSDGEKIVTIRQEPIKYRLLLTKGNLRYKDLMADADTCRLHINTNTDWSVRVKEGSTMDVSFQKTEGRFSSDINIYIGENNDSENGTTATVVISATNCQDIEIPLSQLRCTPYFKLTSGRSYKAVEGVNNATFSFRTNANWRAEIASVEGYNPDYIQGGSGTKAAKNVKIIFPHCCDFDRTEGKIVVRFVAEDVTDTPTITITQKPVIRYCFGTLTNSTMYHPEVTIGMSADTWPFKKPSFAEMPSGSGSAIWKEARTEFELVNGVKVWAYSKNGFWKNGLSGLMFGGAAGNYITIPGFPGHKLVRFVYCYRGPTAFYGNITDEDEVLLPESAFTTGSQGSRTEVIVKGAEPGKTYRLCATSTNNFYMGDVVFYYE